MTRALRLGISTCPNDTFAFTGLLLDRVDRRGLFLDITLHDIHELNEGLRSAAFDAAKASFHAALHLARDHVVLPVGAAIGESVGPLLLSARGSDPPRRREDGSEPRILCPGPWTTAALLYRMFFDAGEVRHTIFDRIMPALKRREADYGVCIHEGRFTYAREGLFLVEDLGSRYEREAGAGLPLGGILARRSLGADVISRLAATIRDSIDYAYAHRDEALQVMRAHAQELDDDVIWAHVDLYVNERTRDLGRDGREALAAFEALARRAGAIPSRAPALEIA